MRSTIVKYTVVDSRTGDSVELDELPVDTLECFFARKLQLDDMVVCQQVTALELDTAVRVTLEMQGPLFPRVDLCRPPASKVLSEDLQKFLERFCARHNVQYTQIKSGKKIPGLILIGHDLLFWKRDLYLKPSVDILTDVIIQMADVLAE